MQTSLAVIVFVLLSATESWPQSRRRKPAADTIQETFKDKLVAANAEIYKAQCYLVGSVQIACIALARALNSQGLVQYGLFFTLATSGYVPIIFSLVCITRFGRSSWYIIGLAPCCFVLSTATLSFSRWYWLSWVPNNINDDSELGHPFPVDPGSEFGYYAGHALWACGNHDPTAILSSWCGSSRSAPFGTRISMITDAWNWIL